MLNRGLDKLELLRIVEAVANEKSIDKELVIESMESAIQKAALTKFGNDNSIEVNIDRESGEIKIQKVLEIVESPEDPNREIALDEAKSISEKKDLKIGDKIFEELPQIDFGRIAARGAKSINQFSFLKYVYFSKPEIFFPYWYHQGWKIILPKKNSLDQFLYFHPLNPLCLD